MKIHFIAIGGSAMHNLAIALHLKGCEVTGSDDEIFDPAKGRLAKYGLLPDTIGWCPEKITSEIDTVILGMHAREDNPELLKAKELNLKIFSYPEFLYEHSKNKTRIVVGGSHGKTTITSMIIHVLQNNAIDCDYMVGAQLAGFEVMVKLSDASPFMVIEGDEYLTSPIDKRPKFHLYHPTIGIISGIAWDHINVFPTFENYIEQFEVFANMISKDGAFIYCKDDLVLNELSEKIDHPHKKPYSVHPHFIQDGVTYLKTEFGPIKLQIFGNHNLSNLNAAKEACKAIGISDEQFYKAISTFKGASKRLELVKSNSSSAVYKDFAHSPSKLKATLDAVRNQYPTRKLIACMELHTFSSLNENFFSEYKGAMNKADIAIIFFDPSSVKHKKLPEINPEIIYKAFNNPNLEIFQDSKMLIDRLLEINPDNSVFLLMSSGNFSGINIEELSNKIVILQP